jgi:hypothetical protein
MDFLGLGASVLGGLIGNSGAKSAAKAQAQATREANQLQKEQYDTTRADQAPYRGYGVASTNKLMQLLGLTAPAGVSASGESREQVRSRLLPQFSKGGGGTGQGGGVPQNLMGLPPDILAAMGYTPGTPIYGHGEEASRVIGYEGGSGGTVDEAGLNAAIERELAGRQLSTDSSAGDFGYLLKNFTGEDLANEPGYQFGLGEGMKGLDRMLARGGMMKSGAALKGAVRFGQDYAGTKFGEAWNRDAGNKTRIYNFLTGGVNTGQNAAAMTGQAGAAMAGQVGANTTANGNAQGAAKIAGAQSWGDAISGGMADYRRNELMDRVLGGNRGFSVPTGGRGYTVPDYAGAEY